MQHAITTEHRAYVAYHLINRILDLLVQKEFISRADCISLLAELANDLDGHVSDVAKRSSEHITDVLAQKHWGGYEP